MYNHFPTYGVLAGGTRGSWSSLVGIVTAIIGNIIISFALNTQRYAHIRIDREFNDGKVKRLTQKRLPKSTKSYGAAGQQEEIAEERARLNAEAPGPGNDEDEATDAFEQPQHGQHQPRKNSFDSDETAKPQEKNGNEENGRKSYLRSPYWWVGITLMVIGEAGNFLAYGFAPASIVSPLGVVALISNCLIAPWMLKERFRQRDFWGVLIAIGGAVTVVLSAKTSEQKMGPEDLWNSIKRWEFLTYIGITCALIIVLMFLSPRYGKRTILIDLGLVALSGGYTALSTKGVASMISGSLLRALTFPITYPLILVLIVSAVFQVRYVNRALSNFNSTQVIPTQFVLFTLSVIIGSAILYRDFEKTDLDHVIKFIVGCALTFTGVWLITSGRKEDNGNDDDGEDNEETIQLIDEEAEIADEQTPLKHERPPRLETRLSYTARRHSMDDITSDKPVVTTSIPSVQLTPSEETDDGNPWTSSTDHFDRMETPQTPSKHHQYSRLNGASNLTPVSPLGTRPPGHPGPLGRVDSAPADPQTPAQGKRGPSPPRVEHPALPPGEIIETPNSTFFRSARGSISRLLPGPFLGPLSSSSLSTVVADSLRKGEGSPRGPIRSRSYNKRPRLTATTRSERSRRRSTTALTDVDEPDLESGLTTPTLSRWQTHNTLTTNRQRSNTDDFEGGESSDDPRSSRRSLLPALSPSFSRLVSMVKDRNKDKDSSDQDESGEGPSSNRGG